MIPRRPLNPPELTEGSAVDWAAPSGIWENGRWTVVMRQDLQVGHVDSKDLEPGGTHVGTSDPPWYRLSMALGSLSVSTRPGRRD